MSASTGYIWQYKINIMVIILLPLLWTLCDNTLIHCISPLWISDTSKIRILQRIYVISVELPCVSSFGVLLVVDCNLANLLNTPLWITWKVVLLQVFDLLNYLCFWFDFLWTKNLEFLKNSKVIYNEIRWGFPGDIFDLHFLHKVGSHVPS